MPVLEVNSVLADTAFGPTPGRAAIGLPSAAGATESWLRAVALGGVGHYAAARAELTRTQRRTTDPILRSLAHSTAGSLLRQLGWHARAAVADGRAAALVVPAAATASRPLTDPVAEAARVEAICDALTGLAADALGTERPELAARLLGRCGALLDSSAIGVEGAWRQRIRLHWVAAETALAAPGAGLISPPGPDGSIPGRSAAAHTPGDPALAHAEAALALAEAGPSIRHRVKSQLLVAAACAAAGDLDRSRALAGKTATECRDFELLPLRWACAMLRSGVDPAGGHAAEAAACADLLAARGGRFRSAA
ncbi:hypothetical protein [Nocardia sp. IFM 10818]